MKNGPNVKSTPPRKLKKAHPGVYADRRLRLNYFLFYNKVESLSFLKILLNLIIKRLVASRGNVLENRLNMTMKIDKYLPFR